jgi:hypothetical protein
MAGTILGGFQTEIISNENSVSSPPSPTVVNLFYDSNDRLKAKKQDGTIIDLSNYTLVQTVSKDIFELVHKKDEENISRLNALNDTITKKLAELQEFSNELKNILNTKANNDAVVHNNTSEQIDGSKTFVKDLTVNGTLAFNGEIIGKIPPQLFVNKVSSGELSIVGSGNTTVSTNGNTIEISSGNYFGSLLTGQIDATPNVEKFTISHQKIEDNSYPIVSLQVPNSAVPLHILGIYNVTNTGFDIVLSGMPYEDGYKINWQRASTGQFNVIENVLSSYGEIEWEPGDITKGSSVVSPEIKVEKSNFGDCLTYGCAGYSLDGFQITPFICSEGVCKITITNISKTLKTLTSAIWGVRAIKNK